MKTFLADLGNNFQVHRLKAIAAGGSGGQIKRSRKRQGKNSSSDARRNTARRDIHL
jgi:hypothetical protein